MLTISSRSVSFQGSLTACRDISPGDEITTSYINKKMPKADRRRELKTKYKFFCTCSVCGPV